MSKEPRPDKKERKREKRAREEVAEEDKVATAGTVDEAEPKQKRQKKEKKSKSKSKDTTDDATRIKGASGSDDFIAFSDVKGDASLASKMVDDGGDRVTSISHGNSSEAYEKAKATSHAIPGESKEEKAARRREHNAAVKKVKKERRAKRTLIKLQERKQKKEARAITAEEYMETGEDVHNKAVKTRFICFVGQLPHNTTVEKVKEHFSKIAPTGIRLPTDKETGKGKGYAFLEFEDFDRMKTCLKLYHHSNFDDGTKKPRKINIELTAGGGGSKSEVRKLRLLEKNFKLTEQRKRRYRTEEEEKAKLEQDAAIKAKRKLKYNKNKIRNDARKKGLAHEGIQETGPAPADTDGLHPARMAMLEKKGKR